METLELLTDTLKTTQEIQSIVRVMKSLSAVSITQFETAVDALGAYRVTVEQGLQVVLHRFHVENGRLPPNLLTDPTGREGYVVIGSDRGMCGRFNETIAAFANDKLASPKEAPMLSVAGLRVAARLKTAGHCTDRLFTLPGSVEGLTELAHSILIQIDRWQRDHGVQTIHVLHNHRGDQSRAEPGAAQLLPVPEAELARLAQTEWPGPSLPCFTMPPDSLLSWLVRQRMFLGVYEALAQSLASEHAARLAAMQAADRNIQERREEIEARYRQKRQENITRELLDIVAGFEAAGSGD